MQKRVRHGRARDPPIRLENSILVEIKKLEAASRGLARRNRPGNVSYIATFREYLTAPERRWFAVVLTDPKRPGAPGSVPENEKLAELAQAVCRRVFADKDWRRRAKPARLSD
jgi:hypothetical protein